MKIIYHYHPETGEFVGQGNADESPLEPGVFLIPAQAVEDAPPAFDAKRQRCFREVDGWVLREIPPPPKPKKPTPEEIREAENNAIKAKLLEIDFASIRALREYIAAKADAPQILKDKEAEATAERGKLKP